MPAMGLSLWLEGLIGQLDLVEELQQLQAFPKPCRGHVETTGHHGGPVSSPLARRNAVIASV
jgi:hypothetical protein